MRLLILTESFPTPEHPGRGIFIREQVEALAKIHSVSVLFPRPALPGIHSSALEPQAGELDKNRCGKMAFPESVPQLNVLRPSYFYVPRHRAIRTWQLSELVRRVLLKAKPSYDLVHAHWLAPAGMAAVRAVRGLGIPVVVTAHAGDVYRDFGRPRHFLVAKRVISEASRIIAVAEYFRQPLLSAGLPPQKLRVIPNGVDIRVFVPADREAARAALQLPANVPLYLYIGNLEQAKGAADVVDAFFSHAPPESVLVVAGTGPLWKSFAKRATESSGRMILRGWQSHDAVAQYLTAANCFILVSYAEGNPVTILESQCCGRPVIGSSIPAISPLIEEGINGLLVPTGDVTALGQAMRDLLTMNWDQASIATKAATQYGWPGVSARVSDVYAEAVTEMRARGPMPPKALPGAAVPPR